MSEMETRVSMLEAAINEIRDSTKSIAESISAIKVLEERHAESSRAIERAFLELKDIELRVRVVEVELPGLKEIRQWVMAGVLSTVAIIGVAVIALVINK